MSDKNPKTTFIKVTKGQTFSGLNISKSNIGGFDTFIDSSEATLNDLNISETHVEVRGDGIVVAGGSRWNIDGLTMINSDQRAQLQLLLEKAGREKSTGTFDRLRSLALSMLRPTEVDAIMRIAEQLSNGS